MDTWPEHERPRERLKDRGPSALGDAELIALLLGSGAPGVNAVDLARQLMASCGGLAGMRTIGLGALIQHKGMGEAKAARLAAAFELGLRVVEQTARRKKSPQFTCSADIDEIYRPRLSCLRQEVFLVVGLNNRNEPVREIIVAKGSATDCCVEPREVFRPLIAEAAVRAVLVHNHPSGDPTPSPADLAVTRRMAEVGEIVGIRILDHLVISASGYVSLRDLGVLGSAPLRESSAP